MLLSKSNCNCFHFKITVKIVITNILLNNCNVIDWIPQSKDKTTIKKILKLKKKTIVIMNS